MCEPWLHIEPSEPVIRQAVCCRCDSRYDVTVPPVIVGQLLFCADCLTVIRERIPVAA